MMSGQNRFVGGIIAAFFLLVFFFNPDPAGAGERRKEVRSIVLHSESLGAHGMGYNTSSMEKMSKKLVVSDIPILFEFYQGRLNFDEMNHISSVAIEFALASLCQDGLQASIQAKSDRVWKSLDYQDTLQLIEGYQKCSATTREHAHALYEKEQTSVP